MAKQDATENYLSKTVRFGNNPLTLYSIDGVTWSSRKDELLLIKERQEQKRQDSMLKKDASDSEGQEASGKTPSPIVPQKATPAEPKVEKVEVKNPVPNKIFAKVKEKKTAVIEKKIELKPKTK